MRFKDFFPPLPWCPRSAPAPEIFPSYAEAAAACGSAAYEEAQLVEMVFRKTGVFREAITRRSAPLIDGAASAALATALAVFLESGARTLRIIDVGGACGAHYFALRALLPLTLQLHWLVVETPAMAARAQDFSGDELRFFDDFATAREVLGPPDLIHSSGTLQYVPEPYDLLHEMTNSGARFLLFSRLLLTAEPADFATVQESRLSDNGPGPLPTGMTDGLCRYPHNYLRRAAIETALKKDHALLLEWNDGAVCHGERLVEKRAYWLKHVR